MATDTGFGDHPFSALSGQQDSPTRTGSATNKRKRESIDHDSSRQHGSSSRGPEMSRRSSSQHQFINSSPTMHASPSTEGYLPAQHRGGNGAPHPSAEDHTTHHFDLSALQQHSNSSTGSHTAQSTTNANMDTAAAALNHYSMNVPPHPAETFLNTPTAGGDNFVAHNPFSLDGGNESSQDPNMMGNPAMKPAVGSEEWHRQRKDSHKEVERRRRETINEGINELAKIVPGTEKNKGTILQRAVQYIKSMHEDASANIDKWTFEKLVTEQAIAELSAKIQRAYDERDAWKRIAREAGVDVDNVDLGISHSSPGQDQRHAMIGEDELGHGQGVSPPGHDDAESSNADSSILPSVETGTAPTGASQDEDMMKVDTALRGIFSDGDVNQHDTSSAAAAVAAVAAAAADKKNSRAGGETPATPSTTADGYDGQVVDPVIANAPSLPASPSVRSGASHRVGSANLSVRQSGRRGRNRT